MGVMNSPGMLRKDDTDTLTDRRRPGRPESISPALLPLLRNNGQAHADLIAEALSFPTGEYPGPDDLSAAKGILVAVLLSMPLWLLAYGASVLIFH